MGAPMRHCTHDGVKNNIIMLTAQAGAVAHRAIHIRVAKH